MEYKDYYKSLGVNRSASKEDIRTAFRNLARQHHPDANEGDQKAEEKFKEINEAYQVLSDPDKRKKYDQLGANWEQYSRAGGQPEDFNWGEWRAGSGSYTRVNVEDLQDMFGGGLGGAGSGGFSDFFETLFGGARAQRAPSRPGRSRNLEQTLEITLEEAFTGTERVFQPQYGSRFEVSIPKGVRTGSKVRVAGKGGESPGGSPADLYLKIKVLPHHIFERKGDNLRVTVDVDLYTALLGGEVSVPTLERPVLLAVKPVAQNGQTIRVRGKGMPNLRKPGERGDLLVTLRVRLPEKLKPEEREVFEKLQRMR
ncbi:MAG TPA: J domain-containing protein [Anaerolineales bacterium]|nr:J domain-containing protein [Anaerolineales bacterium]